MSGLPVAGKPAIEASKQESQQRLVNEVLPPASYDNDLLGDMVRVDAPAALGMDGGARVWRARKGGEPVALVIEGAATDGYAGRIELVVAIGKDGRLSGARVTAHKETPGLGDYIDPKKDRRKDMPWIGQFSIASWKDVNTAEWALRKDGGSATAPARRSARAPWSVPWVAPRPGRARARMTCSPPPPAAPWEYNHEPATVSRHLL